jgi:hypothetical protein
VLFAISRDHAICIKSLMVYKAIYQMYKAIYSLHLITFVEVFEGSMKLSDKVTFIHLCSHIWYILKALHICSIIYGS